MEAQPYKRFRDKVWDHLASYVIDTYGDSVIKGEWHGKPTSHRHILRIDDEPKVEIIRKYNLLKSAQIEPFLLSKPHNEAHHLNSSQIMCYNFFRPQLNADGFVQKPLKDLLNSIIGSTYGEGKACFEYVDHNSEEKKGKTNYDFYVNFEDMKVFFEIKYTENKFDHCKINDGHFEKFEYYSTMMERCGIFKPGTNQWSPSFQKHYQLIRNAINVGENSFVIIISDQRNKSTSNQIKTFKEMLNKSAPLLGHLIFITWQELLILAKNSRFLNEHLKEFEEKYLIPKVI